MDSAGDAVAIWLESDGAQPGPGGGAAGGQRDDVRGPGAISAATADAADPALAMSSGGAAMAVWDDANKSLLGAYSPSAGTAFGGPQTIVNAAGLSPRCRRWR